MKMRITFAVLTFCLPFSTVSADNLMKYFEDFESDMAKMEKRLLDVGCIKAASVPNSQEINNQQKVGKCGWSVLPLEGSDKKKIEKLVLWNAAPAFMAYTPSATLYYVEGELAAADASALLQDPKEAARTFQTAADKVDQYYGNPTLKQIHSLTRDKDGLLAHGTECGYIEWKMVKPKKAPLFASFERRDVYLTFPCPNPEKTSDFQVHEQIKTPLGEKTSAQLEKHLKSIRSPK